MSTLLPSCACRQGVWPPAWLLPSLAHLLHAHLPCGHAFLAADHTEVLRGLPPLHPWLHGQIIGSYYVNMHPCMLATLRC